MTENPYASPQSPPEEVVLPSVGEGAIIRDGKELLVPLDSELPHRCAKCNRPSKASFKALAQTTNHVSTFFYILCIFAVVIGLYAFEQFFSEPIRRETFFLTNFSIAIGISALRYWIDDSKRFGICSRHLFLRWLIHAALLIALCIMFLSDVLLLWQVNLLSGPYTNFSWTALLPFFVFGWIVYFFLGVHVSMKKDENVYRASGCGKAFLGSFPGIEEQLSDEV